MAKRIIDITPDVSLLQKIGNVDFLPSEAIAELVDNALDARKENQKITVNIVVRNDLIIIEDNSSGIQDFDNCMRLAFSQKSDENQLGEFGLGLKTATISLGKRITIETKTAKSNKINYLILDLDEWSKKVRLGDRSI